MEPHFTLTDYEFETHFENCSLNASLFSHEAHLRLAWIHITKYGENIALENVSKQLVNFTAFVGAEHKYNHTITIAAIKAVSHFINKSTSNSFQHFILEFPMLKYNFKDLMGFHYQVDIFKLEKAKKTFLEPDLLPFS
jgi:hypothetical protein